MPNEIINEKYQKDIQEIKSVLRKTEGKSIFATWVFFVYGIILFAGAAVSYVMTLAMDIPVTDVLTWFWIPAIAVMCVLEIIALIRKMANESLAVFSRTNIKLYLGVLGLAAPMLFAAYNFFRAGEFNMLPSLFLCFCAFVYLLYGQVYSALILIHAFALIVLSFILYISELPVELRIVLMQIILGISMLLIGVAEYRKEKNKNGK
jgi:hypothetical protein